MMSPGAATPVTGMRSRKSRDSLQYHHHGVSYGGHNHHHHYSHGFDAATAPSPTTTHTHNIPVTAGYALPTSGSLDKYARINPEDILYAALDEHVATGLHHHDSPSEGHGTPLSGLKRRSGSAISNTVYPERAPTNIKDLLNDPLSRSSSTTSVTSVGPFRVSSKSLISSLTKAYSQTKESSGILKYSAGMVESGAITVMKKVGGTTWMEGLKPGWWPQKESAEEQEQPQDGGQERPERPDQERNNEPDSRPEGETDADRDADRDGDGDAMAVDDAPAAESKQPMPMTQTLYNTPPADGTYPTKPQPYPIPSSGDTPPARRRVHHSHELDMPLDHLRDYHRRKSEFSMEDSTAPPPGYVEREHMRFPEERKMGARSFEMPPPREQELRYRGGHGYGGRDDGFAPPRARRELEHTRNHDHDHDRGHERDLDDHDLPPATYPSRYHDTCTGREPLYHNHAHAHARTHAHPHSHSHSHSRDEPVHDPCQAPTAHCACAEIPPQNSDPGHYRFDDRPRAPGLDRHLQVAGHAHSLPAISIDTDVPPPPYKYLPSLYSQSPHTPLDPPPFPAYDSPAAPPTLGSSLPETGGADPASNAGAGAAPFDIPRGVRRAVYDDLWRSYPTPSPSSTQHPFAVSPASETHAGTPLFGSEPGESSSSVQQVRAGAADRDGEREKSRWQQLVEGAGAAAGATTAVLSDQAERSLRYCLHWLTIATNTINEQLAILRQFLSTLATRRITGPGSSDNTLVRVKAEVVGAIRKAVDIFDRHAGAFLSGEARQRVRACILQLPKRWANLVPGQHTASPSSEAQKILTLAQESLALLSSIREIFLHSLETAQMLLDRLPFLNTWTKGRDVPRIKDKMEE